MQSWKFGGAALEVRKNHVNTRLAYCQTCVHVLQTHVFLAMAKLLALHEDIGCIYSLYNFPAVSELSLKATPTNLHPAMAGNITSKRPRLTTPISAMSKRQMLHASRQQQVR
jgi:hypothetical protein